MNVKELIEWLQAFEDQEATVEVLHCAPGHGYYLQGGQTSSVAFDPKLHSEYVDMRANPFAKGHPHENDHTLLLGLNEG